MALSRGKAEQNEKTKLKLEACFLQLIMRQKVTGCQRRIGKLTEQTFCRWVEQETLQRVEQLSMKSQGLLADAWQISLPIKIDACRSTWFPIG